MKKATTEKPEVIQSADSVTRIARYRVESKYPILMHNPASMFYSSGDSLSQKKIPTPEEEAKASRYVTEDGHLFVPAQAIRNSIVNGGKGRRIGKTAATTMLRAGVFPAEERCILRDPVTEQPLRADDYVIDTRRVVLKKSGGIMRSRAKILKWMFYVDFELDALISDSIVAEVGMIAGRIVGVCDYRPEKSGPFGRYSIQQVAA